MKLAHLADLHLGFRAFARTTDRGVNQREADVALALRRVVDDLLVERPDVVVLAGDVFHSVRPTNGAILTLFQQVQRLRCGLPDTRVVVIAGDHDTPRTSGETFILPLYQALGVDVALLEPLEVVLPELRITAVPRAAVTRIPEAPVELGRSQILVTHGDVPGYGNPHPQWKINPAVLQDPHWDYIALGHYHVCAQVGPRAWYSGSLDYTSSDPWSECRRETGRGKGYLLVDVPGGAPVFRAIVPPRRYADLEPIDASGLAAAEIDAAIAARLADIPLAGAVVRLVVREIHKDARHQLNHAQLRAWRHQALHFQLELQRPSTEGTPEARALMHQSVEERTREFLGARQLPAGIDRAGFVEQGVEYLKAVERT